jgi:hypothetical protein
VEDDMYYANRRAGAVHPADLERIAKRQHH